MTPQQSLGTCIVCSKPAKLGLWQQNVLGWHFDMSLSQTPNEIALKGHE